MAIAASDLYRKIQPQAYREWEANRDFLVRIEKLIDVNVEEQNWDVGAPDESGIAIFIPLPFTGAEWERYFIRIPGMLEELRRRYIAVGWLDLTADSEAVGVHLKCPHPRLDAAAPAPALLLHQTQGGSF